MKCICSLFMMKNKKQLCNDVVHFLNLHQNKM